MRWNNNEPTSAVIKRWSKQTSKQLDKVLSYNDGSQVAARTTSLSTCNFSKHITFSHDHYRVKYVQYSMQGKGNGFGGESKLPVWIRKIEQSGKTHFKNRSSSTGQNSEILSSLIFYTTVHKNGSNI